MPLKFYFDHNVPKSILTGLRLKGIDIVTALEDKRSGLGDNQLLERAFELKRVMFTFDDDFLTVAQDFLIEEKDFYGIIYSHQLKISIGKCIEDLELIASVCDSKDLINQIQFLPL